MVIMKTSAFQTNLIQDKATKYNYLLKIICLKLILKNNLE